MRARLPSACASRRARARAAARAAACGRARVRGVRRRRRGRARARPPLVAALLVQAKTVFDNADGQLARLTGRVTAFGRYLDSECDLLVNAALFAGLGWYTGRPSSRPRLRRADAVLSVNFNVERLARGAPAAWDASVLGRVYGLLYGWQDRLAERFLGGRARPLRQVGALAQLGMSSQLAAFGLCIAVGRPLVYVWLLLRAARLRRRPPSARLHRIRRFRLSIVELPARPEPDDERTITPEEWARYEHYVAEILTAFGMDLETPGTRETPRRFLRAMFEATAGYDGDAKLRTAFPSERPRDVDGLAQPDRRRADLVLLALRASRAAVPRRLRTSPTSPTARSSASRS